MLEDGKALSLNTSRNQMKPKEVMESFSEGNTVGMKIYYNDRTKNRRSAAST